MKKIALFGGSFNPPCIHHTRIGLEVSNFFDQVLVIPCGPRPRTEKQSVNLIDSIHREKMVRLAFEKMPKVQIELFDLTRPLFTRTHLLEEMYKSFGEVWHVVGADLIQGGQTGQSKIQSVWYLGQELWYNLNFVVIKRDGYPLCKDDLPPHSKIFEISNGRNCSSSHVRELVAAGKPFEQFVTPEIADYIKTHNLYREGGKG